MHGRPEEPAGQEAPQDAREILDRWAAAGAVHRRNGDEPAAEQDARAQAGREVHGVPVAGGSGDPQRDQILRPVREVADRDDQSSTCHDGEPWRPGGDMVTRIAGIKVENACVVSDFARKFSERKVRMQLHTHKGLAD